jgi:hypothetical protein
MISLYFSWQKMKDNTTLQIIVIPQTNLKSIYKTQLFNTKYNARFDFLRQAGQIRLIVRLRYWHIQDKRLNSDILVLRNYRVTTISR